MLISLFAFDNVLIHCLNITIGAAAGGELAGILICSLLVCSFVLPQVKFIHY